VAVAGVVHLEGLLQAVQTDRLYILILVEDMELGDLPKEQEDLNPVMQDKLVLTE
jgi:hypothetical protein